jgi:hypothetical protein
VTKEHLNFRIFLLGLFIFLMTIFHINLRIQVVSLGYNLSELRTGLDRAKKKEWDYQLQKEKLMSAKALLALLKDPRYASFQIPKGDQVVFLPLEE